MAKVEYKQSASPNKFVTTYVFEGEKGKRDSIIVPQPGIYNVDINTDEEGRFNLNALHKASGAAKKNGPSYWLALEGTQALIAELEQTLTDTEIPVSAIKVIKGGLNQGTFAHELLAIEYAGWISPRFSTSTSRLKRRYIR